MKKSYVYLKILMKISYIIQLLVIFIVAYSAITETKMHLYHAKIGYLAGLIIFILLIFNIVSNEIIHRYEFKTINKELKNKLKYIKQEEDQLVLILNQTKEPVLIFDENKIQFSNEVFNKALKKFDGNTESGTDKLFYNQMMNYLRDKDQNGGSNSIDLKTSASNGEIIEMTAYLSKILWKGEICNYAVIRDMTYEFKELRRSAQFQRSRMKKRFGFEEEIEFRSIYVPYYVVSGDFYYFKKINEDEVIGILGDVMGKGISAALFNSAMLILFEEGLANSKAPAGILKYINREIDKYLDDNFVAALCFKFNFKTKVVEISSAGINEFIIQRVGETVVKKVNRGAFLGMFEDSEFEIFMSEFKRDDELLFYTDGLEPLFNNTDFIAQLMQRANLEERMNYLQRTIPNSRAKRLDDCTCLGFKMK